MLDVYNTTGIGGFVASPRSWTAAAGGALLNPLPYVGYYNYVSGADSVLGAFPSAVDGQLKVSRVFLAESDNTPRALVPGVYRVPQSGVYAQLGDGIMIDASGVLDGRQLMVVHSSTNLAGNPSGAYLVDITGPWR
jgi:hypothetical protein